MCIQPEAGVAACEGIASHLCKCLWVRGHALYAWNFEVDKRQSPLGKIPWLGVSI